jgi:hypothetical protein
MTFLGQLGTKWTKLAGVAHTVSVPAATKELRQEELRNGVAKEPKDSFVH